MRIFIASLMLCSSGLAGAESLRLVTGEEEQTGISLTVYHNLALIRENREVDLPPGEFELEFQDVARTIDPSSVSIKTAQQGLSVLEQSYRYDLLNKQTLLERFLGRKLKYSRTVREGMRFEKVLREGTLLSINPEVVQFGDEIEIEPEGIISLSYLPDDLKTTPTLLWRLQNDSTGTHGIEVSYIADGIRWQADYNVTVSDDDQKADLQGWVTLSNQSGAGYTNARVKLVAGDVRRIGAQPPRPQLMRAESMAMADAAAMPQRQSLGDYHLYDLPRAIELDMNTVKQVKLLELADLNIERRYLMSSEVQTYQAPDVTSVPVQVMLTIEPRKREDVPLPAGKYHVYKEDSDNELQFLGEDQVGHTASGGDIDLNIGQAFDLVAERTQTIYRRLGDRSFEVAYKISVKNAHSETVDVEIAERLMGDWRIVEQSQRGDKRDSRTQTFTLTVKPGATGELTYRAQTKF